MSTGPPKAAVVGAGVIAAAGIGVAVASPVLVAAPPTGLVMWRHWAARTRRRRLARQLAADVPRFVDELIQFLKAGRSLPDALRSTLGPALPGSPLVGALAPLRSALAAGVGLEAALAQMQAHAETDLPPGLELVIDTLGVLVQRGGPALPSLERLSDTLRSAEAVDQEVRAQAAQATASSAVLAGLPVLFVAALVVLDERMAAFYVSDPVGAACLLVAALLSYAAWWWMDHLIERQR